MQNISSKDNPQKIGDKVFDNFKGGPNITGKTNKERLKERFGDQFQTVWREEDKDLDFKNYKPRISGESKVSTLFIELSNHAFFYSNWVL